jgi:sugar phosphate isomerase/epimerase
MIHLRDYFSFGISVGLLYPEANQSSQRHLSAFTKTAKLPGFETLETLLAEDAAIRKTEISIMKEEGKIINYNFPVDFQLGGEFDPGSPDATVRKKALDLAKRHVDYAQQASSKVIGMTSGIDHGVDNRKQTMGYFSDYMASLSEYSAQAGITLTLEPVERGVFKNLLLGPTPEVCSFIQNLQDRGHANVKILFDTAHMPLMQEDALESVALASKVGIGHIHIGNAIVRNQHNPLYGHFHPPIGIQDGEYDYKDVGLFFGKLIEYGHLSKSPTKDKKCISLEMAPYPGLSPELSAAVAYEKVCSAWEMALRS